MVLVHYAPSAINLSETHRQSKFQLLPLAFRVYVYALPCGRGEGHVRSGSSKRVYQSSASAAGAGKQQGNDEASALVSAPALARALVGLCFLELIRLFHCYEFHD